VSEEDPLGVARLGLLWGIPFAGLLLSIALLPAAMPRFWHRHYGKTAAAWALAFLVPLVATRGVGVAAHVVAHAMLLDYVPFVVLLLALYTVTGGIAVTGTLRGTPGVNTLLLAVGTAIASITGTTGAAMLMVRPLLRANRGRTHVQHIFVFFIILVANVGGALSPVGDPPLFLGFMEGVPFFWPTVHLFLPTLTIAAALLLAFHLLDSWLGRRSGLPDPEPVEEVERLRVRGARNLALLGAIILCVLMSGIWDPGISLPIAGAALELPKLLSTLLLLAIVGVSLRFTSERWRRANNFTWHAMAEVAILFASIFLTIVPVLHLIAEGAEGPARPMIALLSGPPAYFWLTGVLSAFLDNAPTYLVFFSFAGGDAAALTGPDAETLLAISMGAVYFGALTYIGNAPNFMVRSVAESEGVKMPSFFLYLFWTSLLLVPLFGLVTLLFL
jgi:Na+/H+ antiporter NhaD/arsenite permease-like protein